MSASPTDVVYRLEITLVDFYDKAGKMDAESFPQHAIQAFPYNSTKGVSK